MKYIFTVIHFLIAIVTCCQESFIIRDDLGHLVNIAYMVAESDKAYHIIGLTVEPDTSRQSPFVLDIGKDGSYNPSDYSIYRDSLRLMFMNLNNKKYQIDNRIQFGVSTINGQFILEYDTDSRSLNLKDLILFDDRRDTTIHHFFPFEEGYLLGGVVESTKFGGESDYIIMRTDIDSEFILRADEPGFYELCRRIVVVDDSTYCAMISTNTSEVTFASMKLLFFNDKGDSLNLVETGVESYRVEDAILDSDGNFLISSYDFVKLNSDPDFDVGHYTPYLMKMDESGNILWKRTYGAHIDDGGKSSKYASLIESFENDGYIIAGSDFSALFDPFARQSHAVLAKVSLDGDSLWYRKYATIDTVEDFFHVFNDVIATQDGGYLAVGDQTYFNTEEGRTTNSLLIVKTNAEGLVVPDTTNSVVTLNDQSQFQIYPNPSSDYLYINKDITGEWNFSIHDMSGKRMLAQELNETKITYMIDLQMFAPGTYIIRFTNGETTYSEKIVVK